MSVTSTHPQFAAMLEDWELMRHAHVGERAVKEAGERYLPPTSGMVRDGMGISQPGRAAYESYQRRATYPEVVRDAVAAMIGVMHSKPAIIELPARMEPLVERATVQGESLQMLLQRINEEQLVSGRLGLVLDVPDGPSTQLPYIAFYAAESIRNWDAAHGGVDLSLVVLDESSFERDGFDWEWKARYRVLTLHEGRYLTGLYEAGDETLDPDGMLQPSISGRWLDFVPFSFINTTDVVSSPSAPPLVGLARLAMCIYRGDADYRQSLFMQGQDTLVVVGSPDEQDALAVGANAVISLPMGGDAKFIGVDSAGLPEMRQAQETSYNRAMQLSGQLLDSVSRERESGEALKIRVAARTATLNRIAVTGAYGLEQLLRQAAVWVGADPNQVLVQPNLDFVDAALAGTELVQYVTAKAMGAPLSMRSLHQIMQERDLTTMTFEEELEALEAEQPLATRPGEDEGE